MSSPSSKRNIQFFRLKDRHYAMVDNFVDRVYPRFRTDAFPSVHAVLVHLFKNTLSNNPTALICAIREEGKLPVVAGLVWVEEPSPLPYFHILLDQPYLRLADQLLEQAALAMFQEIPEAYALRVVGNRTSGIHRFLAKQPIGDLSWVKNGGFDAASASLVDQWEFIIPRFKTATMKDRPIRKEPPCREPQNPTRTRRAESRQSGQRHYPLWLRKLFQGAVQLFIPQ